MLIEMRPIGGLTPHPRNYRRHGAEQLAVLAQSLQTHGWARPVVIMPDGTILAGHGLVAAARAMGTAEVPCHVYTGPNPEALLVMDNRAAALGEDDPVALFDLLRELEQGGALDDAGFDQKALADVARLVAEEVARDGRARPAEEHLVTDDGAALAEDVRPGQVWGLGVHRLAVGPPTETLLTTAMMPSGARYALAVLMPPAGTVDGDLFEALSVVFPFAADGAAALLLVPPVACMGTWVSMFNDVGFRVAAELVWPFPEPVQDVRPAPFLFHHASVLYGVVEGAVPCVGVDPYTAQRTTLLAACPPESLVRLPQPILTTLMDTLTRHGATVYVPWAWDAAPLLAAHRLGRVVCMGVEVAVGRRVIAAYEAETGESASLLTG